ncbi:MAG: cation diffusion facilitator family transporter [Candidatus Zixiibacteriota bacterium]
MAEFGTLQATDESAEDLAVGTRATWIGVGVNVVLMASKLFAGALAGSQALIADGLHSLSDLFSDAVVLFGFRWGRKHEDEDHLYGHARIETISTMIVGLVLIIVGFGIAYNAIGSIYRHQPSHPGLLAVWVSAASIISKEWLFWYTLRIGRRLKSLALIGNAWHHRSDALSSVAVLVGVVAARIDPAWQMADSYAALVVTFFVGKVGFSLIWSALRELSDAAPDREVLEQIAETASEVDGVLDVHDMRARYSGSTIFVEMHIVVDGDQSVRAGHDIARRVKRGLLDSFVSITHVIIHVDPEEG